MIMWHKVTPEFIAKAPDLLDGLLWVRYLDKVYFGKYTWTQGRNPDKFICWFENGLCEMDAVGCYVQQAIEPIFNNA
jgi:hypothetical protein